MNITAIFLSNTSNEDKFQITRHAITSLKYSNGWGDNQIVVVETQPESNLKRMGFSYDGVDMVHPEEEFKYNRFLNLGIDEKRKDSEWILVCNNDIIFDKFWLDEMKKVINHDSEILSLSPRCPEWHLHKDKTSGDYEIGHDVSNHICGWCILFHYDSVYKKLGLFDEDFEYYYQDNDYSLTIKGVGIKHALVYKSHVKHLLSKSQDLITDKENYYWTSQRNLLNKKWNL